MGIRPVVIWSEIDTPCIDIVEDAALLSACDPRVFYDAALALQHTDNDTLACVAILGARQALGSELIERARLARSSIAAVANEPYVFEERSSLIKLDSFVVSDPQLLDAMTGWLAAVRKQKNDYEGGVMSLSMPPVDPVRQYRVAL